MDSPSWQHVVSPYGTAEHKTDGLVASRMCFFASHGLGAKSRTGVWWVILKYTQLVVSSSLELLRFALPDLRLVGQRFFRVEAVLAKACGWQLP